MALQISQHDGEAPPGAPGVVLAYDFASPESYLALELLAKPMAALTPELVPVHAPTLGVVAPADSPARREQVERLAAGAQLLAVQWPASFPQLDTRDAATLAGYAKSIGKVAVFSLSLFRQIYAGGLDPADRTTLYLAAVASEIHPRAVDQALARDSVRRRADEQATELARGIGEVPALRLGTRLLQGDAVLRAAAGLAEPPAGG